MMRGMQATSRVCRVLASRPNRHNAPAVSGVRVAAVGPVLRGPAAASSVSTRGAHPSPHPARSSSASSLRIASTALRPGRPLTRLRALASEAELAEEPSTSSWVDTHCHMDLILGKFSLGVEAYPEWRSSLPQEEAFEACLTIGCSTRAFEPNEAMLGYDGVYGAFGIHPLSAAEWGPEVEARVRALQAHPKVVAVGECGLDYHYENDEDMREKQHEVFVAQMQLAAELGKPLIVHTREAEEDTLELMRAHLPRDTKVHVHCFTSSAALAEALLEDFPNLHVGFTGVVTFKNAAEIREVVKRVPLNRILLETDGPYMAPVPHRGKPAHPGYVQFIASEIAKVKEVEAGEVMRQAREATTRVYGI